MYKDIRFIPCILYFWRERRTHTRGKVKEQAHESKLINNSYYSSALKRGFSCSGFSVLKRVALAV